MNRIIKFRVWDKNKKVMIVSFPHDTNWELQNDPYITMQFTGLKDKNGKEIYEGDIVKLENGEINQIWYSEEYAEYQMGKNYKGVFDNIHEDSIYMEVIGNIYTDKHLLADRK